MRGSVSFPTSPASSCYAAWKRRYRRAYRTARSRSFRRYRDSGAGRCVAAASRKRCRNPHSVRQRVYLRSRDQRNAASPHSRKVAGRRPRGGSFKRSRLRDSTCLPEHVVGRARGCRSRSRAIVALARAHVATLKARNSKTNRRSGTRQKAISLARDSARVSIVFLPPAGKPSATKRCDRFQSGIMNSLFLSLS